MADTPKRYDSADERAHGTHGKGDTREKRLFDSPTLPGNEDDIEEGPKTNPDDATGKLSGAGWGDAAAGGSVEDKR